MDTSSLERLLLSTLVMQDEVSDFYNTVKDEWFADEECRAVWRLVRGYYIEHRESIPQEVLLAQRPGFHFAVGAQGAEGVVESVRNRWIEREGQDILDEAELDFDDPEHGISSVIADLTALRARIESKTGTDIAATARTARTRYNERRESGGKIGLEWPWAPLQDATNGAAYGNYTILYARPKNCKTFVLLYILILWKAIYNRKILLINRELSVDQVQDRTICLLAELDYTRFKRGELTPDEDEAFAAAEEMFESWGNFIVESIDTDGKEAAVDVDALCEKYGLEEGDIVAVDGMYFYAESGSDWKTMKAFSQGIQKMFRRRKVIGICTTQGNRQQGKKGADAGEEMGLGDGPIQDCDLAIRVGFNGEEQDITMAIRAIRDGWTTSWVIHAKMCTDFTLKYSNAYVPTADDAKRDKAKGGKATSKRQASHGAARSPTVSSMKGKKNENVRPRKGSKEAAKAVRGAKRRTIKPRRARAA